MPHNELEAFLSLDFGQRKQIIAVDDDDLKVTAKARRGAKIAAKDAAAGAGGAAAGAAAAAVLVPAAGGAAGLGAYAMAITAGGAAAGPAAPIVWIGGGIGALGALAGRRVRDRQREKVRRLVNPSIVKWSIARELDMPPGHPQRETVYEAHPLASRTYYPLNRFHPLLFENKVAEAIRLLAALGASEIDVNFETGYTTEIRREAVLGAARAGRGDTTTLDSDAGGYQGSYRFRLSPKRGEVKVPYVPDDLVWLEHEPGWQSIADARLNSGLDRFEIQVTTTDDYGITQDVSAALKKLKLKGGGSFQQHLRTSWVLTGSFS